MSKNIAIILTKLGGGRGKTFRVTGIRNALEFSWRGNKLCLGTLLDAEEVAAMMSPLYLPEVDIEVFSHGHLTGT